MKSQFPVSAESTTSSEIVWILGGGQFGHRAVQLLRKASPAAAIVVVEKRLLLDFPDDIEAIQADGVEWLVDTLTPASTVTRIIPALPVHLAAEWLKITLQRERHHVSSIEIPADVLNQLPNPARLTPSTVTISHADFLCPSDCLEPDEFCTCSGRQRPLPLYRLLETMKCAVLNQLILRSRQFAPGVGGFFPNDLWNLLEQARRKTDRPLLIGTACKCHGIIDGIYHSKV